MHPLPPDYRTRPMTLDDLSETAQLANAYASRFRDGDMTNEQQLRGLMTTPGFDRDTSSRWVIDASGRPAAAAFVFHRSPHVRIQAWGLVGESHQGRGIGSALHAWILTRAQAAVDLAPNGAQVALRQQNLDRDDAAATFLHGSGYALTRHY